MITPWEWVLTKGQTILSLSILVSVTPSNLTPANSWFVFVSVEVPVSLVQGRYGLHADIYKGFNARKSYLINDRVKTGNTCLSTYDLSYSSV